MRDESEQPYSPEYGRSWAKENPAFSPSPNFRAHVQRDNESRIRELEHTLDSLATENTVQRERIRELERDLARMDNWAEAYSQGRAGLVRQADIDYRRARDLRS